MDTASVKYPPSSCPTYPGGEPINLEIVCSSVYSDISILIKAFSESNKSIANYLHNSVLPTPDEPRNKKLPIGYYYLLRCALFLHIALQTASIA